MFKQFISEGVRTQGAFVTAKIWIYTTQFWQPAIWEIDFLLRYNSNIIEQISVNSLDQQILYWSVVILWRVFVKGNKANRKHLIYIKKIYM